MKANPNIVKAIEILSSYSPSSHYLWDESKLHCSPAKIDFLSRVKKKGLNYLSENEWNTLMFSVVYTIGDTRSFDFLLPKYLKKIFNDKIGIIHFEHEQLQSKLEYVEYSKWPKEKRDAVDLLSNNYKIKNEFS